MIEALVGNNTVEKILLYMMNYQEGYISGIAETFHISKSQVRKQLIRLEMAVFWLRVIKAVSEYIPLIHDVFIKTNWKVY